MAVTSALQPGNLHDVIGDVLNRRPHDLQVMGASSHSPLRQLFLGSKTSQLLKSAGLVTLLLR